MPLWVDSGTKGQLALAIHRAGNVPNSYRVKPEERGRSMALGETSIHGVVILALRRLGQPEEVRSGIQRART